MVHTVCLSSTKKADASKTAWVCFIKIIKNEVYVSDFNQNLMRIFDTDCNVIGTIPTNECPQTYDIMEGADGLYVVGKKKIGIYSRVPNGDFLHHLNIQPSSVKLCDSRGICFDCSGHLFITQGRLSSHGVYVFTSSGEHIASFGLPGSGVSMVWPAGIAIDEDGFVYVCDYTSINNKVIVFWNDCLLLSVSVYSYLYM